jgi:hypothetical protein
MKEFFEKLRTKSKFYSKYKFDQILNNSSLLNFYQNEFHRSKECFILEENRGAVTSMENTVMCSECSKLRNSVKNKRNVKQRVGSVLAPEIPYTDKSGESKRI